MNNLGVGVSWCFQISSQGGSGLSHALPGRVTASESSSSQEKPIPMKRPSRKTKNVDKEEDDDPPKDAEHDPLGGSEMDDEDREDGNDGASAHDQVPEELRPPVSKKPATRSTATAAKKKPSKKTKSNERGIPQHMTWFHNKTKYIKICFMPSLVRMMCPRSLSQLTIPTICALASQTIIH